MGPSSRRSCQTIGLRLLTALGTPSPDFLSGFTPLASPQRRYSREAAEVLNRSFPPLDELPAKVYEPHLPEATGFKAPVARLRPFSCRWKRGPPDLSAKSLGKARSWTIVSRGYWRRTPWGLFERSGCLSPTPIPGYANLGPHLM